MQTLYDEPDTHSSILPREHESFDSSRTNGVVAGNVVPNSHYLFHVFTNKRRLL
jgi:hypothetical protein